MAVGSSGYTMAETGCAGRDMLHKQTSGTKKCRAITNSMMGVGQMKMRLDQEFGKGMKNTKRKIDIWRPLSSID